MKATCSFSSCDRPMRSLGLCDSHYAQQRRNGQLTPIRRLTSGTPAERLEAYTSRTTDCWFWTGSTRNGYGQIRVGDRVVRAHRLAYELEYGNLADSVMLDHHCRNRACVRPDHLVPTTNKQNMENLARSGYSGNSSGVRGVTWDSQTSRWRAKLTHEGRTIHVGRFDTIDQAASAIIEARNRVFSNNVGDRS
ncbi:HNH endonuclease signature motif containing protein [Microbacterium esteraromaticum]|uniref:HNH endonuclease signature motif containing protein n=1 Tax=Microbacterium esteraromaticum TaxID=57043 RepID=UPI0023683085|nr:HNH endonuclease signature motif containing protein [Microbacterium esteraromaticum]WDH80198.1 HNH endonuclease signature motif containing protein [Microbacterium esteraromaticum]